MIKLSLFVLLGSGLSAVAQSSGTFVPTGDMTIARASHTATLLEDGRVLLTGGVNASHGYAGSAGTAELYDPSTGKFSAAGNMTTNRAGHTATLLSDGRVLINGDYTGQPSSELYDPATGRFTPTGSTVDVRGTQSSNLLSNGKVLLTGVPSAELYDPVSGTFTRIANMDHGTGAVVLKNDKVVIVGGSDVSLYDVTANSLTLLASLPASPIYDQTATLLANGKVLIAGGDSNRYGESTIADAMLYDPRKETVDATGRLPVSRAAHTATLLPGGRVLVYGGFHDDGNFKGFDLADAEEYDPATGTFTSVGSSAWPRGGHTATLLHDGTVLIAGGAFNTSAELYIPPLRAASAASLAGPLAPESLASLFGSRLALATESGDSLSPSTSLGGISLRVVDSSGVARFAPLLYISPSQINFEVPAGTVPGSVSLEVVNAPAQIAQITAPIDRIAPGLFAFEDNTAAAYALRLETDGKETVLSVRDPIVLDNRPVYLVLYATGIRNRSSMANVRCTIGGISMPVDYAGPEGNSAPGLDQVNVRLTPALKGLGVASLVLTVDGASSNIVTVDIR